MDRPAAWPLVPPLPLTLWASEESRKGGADCPGLGNPIIFTLGVDSGARWGWDRGCLRGAQRPALRVSP